jgi:hypothetical protein
VALASSSPASGCIGLAVPPLPPGVSYTATVYMWCPAVTPSPMRASEPQFHFVEQTHFT